MNMQKRQSTLSMGRGVGLGHGGNSKLPPIKARELTEALLTLIAMGGLEPGTQLYELSECSILVSPPLDDSYGWHMSIAHHKRYPTWDEIAKARYELLPQDRTYVMVLPKPDDYINVHNFCFQVWEDGKRRER